MAQLVIALLFLGHGIGHFLFLANSWGYWKGAVGRASFFENVLHATQSVESMVGILWLIPLVGFLGAAWGFYNVTPWWRTVALASALLSAVLIVVWWSGLTSSSAFFALVFDVAVVAILLYQQSTGIVSSTP